MTVKKIPFEEHYIGLSTDEKPADVNDGSRFHCVDTGEEYIYFDGTWEIDLRLTRALQLAL